jgi:hypothetical protein
MYRHYAPHKEIDVSSSFVGGHLTLGKDGEADDCYTISVIASPEFSMTFPIWGPVLDGFLASIRAIVDDYCEPVKQCGPIESAPMATSSLPPPSPGTTSLLDVYYDRPEDAAREAAITEIVARHGGRSRFKHTELPVGHREDDPPTPIWLGFEFADFDDAVSAQKALLSRGEWAEPPCEIPD